MFVIAQNSIRAHPLLSLSPTTTSLLTAQQNCTFSSKLKKKRKEGRWVHKALDFQSPKSMSFRHLGFPAGVPTLRSRAAATTTQEEHRHTAVA